ncbi:hypothetical protein GCM10010260_26870 [Streptomyces filipinensis]|uniref:Uncharacterized protein n=1 Tax=Streptomyces filipinensis TaxID=66887 RepID=A0A918I9D8_9ACTN|nr:hypothetical protein GCM10010260_26870 [Streptomyces filipinensis]
MGLVRRHLDPVSDPTGVDRIRVVPCDRGRTQPGTRPEWTGSDWARIDRTQIDGTSGLTSAHPSPPRPASPA